MGPRDTIDHLLALEDRGEGEAVQGRDSLRDMAMTLLPELCSELAFALAGARGRSAHGAEARKQAAEQVEAIQSVLAVWEMAGFEVVSIPCQEDCPLEPPRRN